MSKHCRTSLAEYHDKAGREPCMILFWPPKEWEIWNQMPHSPAHPMHYDAMIHHKYFFLLDGAPIQSI